MAFEEVFNGIRLSRIWSDAKDVDIRHYIVYVNDDGVACVDPEGTVPIGAEMLMDLYFKSLLVFDRDGVLYTPLSMSQGNPTISIYYAKVDNGDPKIAVATSYESAPIVDPELVALSIGGKVLTPEFSAEVLAYTMTTTDLSDLLAFEVAPPTAMVLLTLNGVAIEEPLLTWAPGANILTISLAIEGVTTAYTITVTKEDPPVIPVLASLDVGSKVLTPEFSAEVHEYAVATADTSNLIALTAAPLTATVAMTLNGEAVVNMEEAFVWVLGENIVTISLTVEEITTVYTITVTNTAE